VCRNDEVWSGFRCRTDDVCQEEGPYRPNIEANIRRPPTSSIQLRKSCVNYLVHRHFCPCSVLKFPATLCNGGYHRYISLLLLSRTPSSIFAFRNQLPKYRYKLAMLLFSYSLKKGLLVSDVFVAHNKQTPNVTSTLPARNSFEYALLSLMNPATPRT
jgi:hypothetical protein